MPKIMANWIEFLYISKILNKQLIKIEMTFLSYVNILHSDVGGKGHNPGRIVLIGR